MDKHREHKTKDKEHHEHAREGAVKKQFDSSDEELEKKMENEKASDERRKEDRRLSHRRDDDRLAHEAKNKALEENLKLRGEMDALKDTMMRRQADFENYKKRMAKQQGESRKMAIRDITHDIIPINDDLLRAMEASENILKTGSIEESHRSFVEGVSMISKRIEETMMKYGVTEIDALNQEFDPNLHEAVDIETGGDVAFDTVTRVYQKGFRIDDLVVRSARVRVTKPKKEDDPAAPPGSGETVGDGGEESVH